MNLRSIFDYLTPENIKSIPVVRAAMNVFIDSLERNSEVASRISAIFDQTSLTTDSDIVKKAMLAVTDLLKKESCSAQLLLQVHDELIFECDQGEADTAAALIRQGMESVVALRVPLKVSVEIGPRWGDFH